MVQGFIQAWKWKPDTFGLKETGTERNVAENDHREVGSFFSNWVYCAVSLECWTSSPLTAKPRLGMDLFIPGKESGREVIWVDQKPELLGPWQV